MTRFMKTMFRFGALALIGPGLSIAAAGCPAHPTASESAPPTPTPSSPNEAHTATAAALVDPYLAVQVALVADDLDAAKSSARSLEKAAAGQAEVSRAASSIVGAKDLAAARTAFGDASKALITLVANEPDAARGLHAFNCPMTKTYPNWLQRGEATQNPYMGTQMPGCGSKVPMAP